MGETAALMNDDAAPFAGVGLQAVPGSAQVARLSLRTDMFEDGALKSIQSRALAYLRADVPVHLRGPAGTGKTTLAMQIAARLGRPAVLLTGDSQFTTRDLIGGPSAVRTKQIHDRYIHSVRKVESETKSVWEDSVLTTAFQEGYTLVYDEFTRSPADANTALLSALEERVLVFSAHDRDVRYVPAHPDFRAIFTSNPEEYAGVDAPQDALLDRMITFDLGWHDAATEAGIVAARSGLSAQLCLPIVTLVRRLRANAANGEAPLSLRAAILVARIARAEGLTPSASDERFVQLCFDVLESRAPRGADLARREAFFKDLRALILACCPAQAPNLAAVDMEARL